MTDNTIDLAAVKAAIAKPMERGSVPMIIEIICKPLLAECERLQGEVDDAKDAIRIWKAGFDKLTAERDRLRKALRKVLHLQPYMPGEHACIDEGHQLLAELASPDNQAKERETRAALADTKEAVND